MIALGGANRHSLAILLMNALTRYVGMCLG